MKFSKIWVLRVQVIAINLMGTYIAYRYHQSVATINGLPDEFRRPEWTLYLQAIIAMVLTVAVFLPVRRSDATSVTLDEGLLPKPENDKEQPSQQWILYLAIVNMSLGALIDAALMYFEIV